MNDIYTSGLLYNNSSISLFLIAIDVVNMRFPSSWSTVGFNLNIEFIGGVRYFSHNKTYFPTNLVVPVNGTNSVLQVIYLENEISTEIILYDLHNVSNVKFVVADPNEKLLYLINESVQYHVNLYYYLEVQSFNISSNIKPPSAQIFKINIFPIDLDFFYVLSYVRNDVLSSVEYYVNHLPIGVDADDYVQENATFITSSKGTPTDFAFFSDSFYISTNEGEIIQTTVNLVFNDSLNENVPKFHHTCTKTFESVSTGVIKSVTINKHTNQMYVALNENAAFIVVEIDNFCQNCTKPDEPSNQPSNPPNDSKDKHSFALQVGLGVGIPVFVIVVLVVGAVVYLKYHNLNKRKS
eukprot:TRINITY_DN1535_c0_g1_i1.p1 TRINITY_DN1535_c0_g1~~TRINITY_DN1535_c0_g1_i1.p1  ORF type:complete len:352 (+),score=56.36 TRINITY_DN1535_c0_g1_i1:391-1446(+)